MISRRVQFQGVLEQAEGLAIDPVLNGPAVYFQPPSSVRMVYPCIVYHLDDVTELYADNKTYKAHDRYLVTVIDPNPDSTIHHYLRSLELSRFSRFYTSDNLNHFVYEVYF